MSNEEKEDVEDIIRSQGAFFGGPDMPLSEADQEALWDDYLDWCRRNENVQHE